MSYALNIITRDKAQAKSRIAQSNLPDPVKALLMTATDTLTTEDTSPNTYVVQIIANGEDASGEVSGSYSIKRVEVLGSVEPQAPVDHSTDPTRQLTQDEINAQRGAGPLRQDGPTFDEYVASGHDGATYPPQGYADKRSPDEIARLRAERDATK